MAKSQEELLQEFASMDKKLVLVIKPTNECYNGCGHCFREKKEGNLSREGVDQIVEQLQDNRIPLIFSSGDSQRSVDGVEISGGGDPLTYPHLAYLVERLSIYEPGILTSGRHLTTKKLQELKQVGFSGKLGLSVDIFRPPGYVAEAIRNCLEVFHNPQISLTVTQAQPRDDNDQVVKRAYTLKERNGTFRIGLHWDVFDKFVEIIEQERRDWQISEQRVKELLGKFPAVDAPSYGCLDQMLDLQFIGNAQHLDTRYFKWHDLYERIDPGSAFECKRETFDRCSLKGQIVIEPNGDIKPCSMPGSDTDALTIGNIYRATISDAVLNIPKNPIVHALFFKGGIYTLIECLRDCYVN